MYKKITNLKEKNPKNKNIPTHNIHACIPNNSQKKKKKFRIEKA